MSVLQQFLIVLTKMYRRTLFILYSTLIYSMADILMAHEQNFYGFTSKEPALLKKNQIHISKLMIFLRLPEILLPQKI